MTRGIVFLRAEPNSDNSQVLRNFAHLRRSELMNSRRPVTLDFRAAESRSFRCAASIVEPLTALVAPKPISGLLRTARLPGISVVRANTLPGIKAASI